MFPLEELFCLKLMAPPAPEAVFRLNDTLDLQSVMALTFVTWKVNQAS
jgi:hypothetical protein